MTGMDEKGMVVLRRKGVYLSSQTARDLFTYWLSCYQMNKKPSYPGLCLIVGGGLCLFVLHLLLTAQGNWHPLLRPVAAAAFAPLVIVMLRGGSWQKMLAAALLFVPSFGLLASVME